MDIVIRNGKIDNVEGERIMNIKNEEELIKKNYTDYKISIPGPYYDFFNSHLCIPRRACVINNFRGPQDSYKMKIVDNTDKINKKDMYCSICHKFMKENMAFSSKKRILIDVNIHDKKPNQSDILEIQLKKMKLESDNKNIEELFEKCLVKKNPYKNWYKIYDSIKNHTISKSLLDYKNKQKRVVNNYYKLCYKLIKKPHNYEIGCFETKLAYPWELTPYQNFKLLCPDYKNSTIFNHQNQSNFKIKEKYVTIE